MNEHRVTGSSVTRERRGVPGRKTTVPGKKGKIILMTVVTLTCSCGQSVEGAGKSFARAEVNVRLAYNRHKR